MAGTLLCVYIGGWIATSILATVLALRLRDGEGSAPNSTLVSILAGAAWPVLVLALAEAAVVAMTAEILHEDDRVLAYES